MKQWPMLRPKPRWSVRCPEKADIADDCRLCAIDGLNNTPWIETDEAIYPHCAVAMIWAEFYGLVRREYER